MKNIQIHAGSSIYCITPKERGDIAHFLQYVTKGRGFLNMLRHRMRGVYELQMSCNTKYLMGEGGKVLHV